jgi:hypothetical protein
VEISGGQYSSNRNRGKQGSRELPTIPWLCIYSRAIKNTQPTHCCVAFDESSPVLAEFIQCAKDKIKELNPRRRVYVEIPRPSALRKTEANAFSLWNNNLGYQGILEFQIKFEQTYGAHFLFDSF